MEIKNAQIQSANLYIEDHDILTFSIGLNLGHGYCSIGGYCLDQAFRINDSESERLSTPAGLDCIRKIMEIVDVSDWNNLTGKYIRYEDDGWGSKITKIGHIMKDNWLDVDKFFKEYSIQHWIDKVGQTVVCKDYMTPDEFKNKMLEIANSDEGIDEIHSSMDGLMCELLTNSGYKEGVEIFQNTDKWYA